MTDEQWAAFGSDTFTGFDTDPTMLRISAMNLMLHSISNPRIQYQDSVSKQNEIQGEFTICLANPPFKGTVDAEIISDNLKAVTNTKKTELLFVALFLRMLRNGGRCACIVPDGVLFGSSKAHVSIRKELVENHMLQAVISMPSGVFKPYAGVSTAVLVFTKTGAGGTDNVWLGVKKLRGQELIYLDELIKARFVEMFGDLADPACKWEKCKLVDACTNPDDIKCGPFGTQLGKDEYTEDGVAVWEIPQINSEFKSFPTHFVTEKKAEELDAYSIIPGDIAMSRKGNVGRCAVFPATFKNGIIHSDVLRIRLDITKALPEFMMRQLHYSGDVQHQIELVSSGAIMAGINVTKLKQILIYLPPIYLQKEFADFVAQVDKSKSEVQKALDETQKLFDSLMQEYFG